MEEPAGRRRSGNQSSVSSADPWDEKPVCYVHFKCHNCLCVAVYFDDDPDVQSIMTRGSGLKNPWLCSCACHSGIGALPRLGMKRDKQ